MSGAGAGTLGTSFAEALKQIGPQLNVLKANFDNLMINAGKLLLPAVADVIKWVNGFASELNKNKTLRDVLGVGAATLFAGALATKVASIGITIAEAFGVAVEAGVAGTIGAAIGAALLAVLVTGTGKQITTGVKQVTQGNFLSGFSNLIGGIDNTIKGLVSKIPVIGSPIANIIQPTNFSTVGVKPTGSAKKTTSVKVTVKPK